MPTNTDERPRVYLNKVQLKGYKSIEDVTIDFQKGLNILIGKNGAGKSNFLEFINLSISFRENLKIPFQYVQLEFISDDDYTFKIEYEKKFQRGKEHFLDSAELSEKFYINNKIAFDNSNSKNSNAFEFKGQDLPYKGIARLLFFRMGYKHVFPFYIKYSLPEKLACIDSPGVLKAKRKNKHFEWEFPEASNFIKDTFWELESFIAKTSNQVLININTTDILEHLKVNDNIIDNLKLYTTIEDVRFNGINLYLDDSDDLLSGIIVDNIKLDFKINGNWLPWSQLSDGTRRLFYIVSEVTSTQGLVLLDEPELGVHPHQFHLLMNFLKEQSEHKQIIISTHAPKALDHLSFDELNNLLITYYDPEKGTQLKHLSEKQRKSNSIFRRSWLFQRLLAPFRFRRMKIKVGLVAEDYFDSLSIKNLLEQRYKEKVHLVPFAKGIKGTKFCTKKMVDTIKAETRGDSFKLIVYIADLDAFESQTELLKAKENLFHKANDQLKIDGLFLLNIWELEALIFGDIDAFNKMYHTKEKANRNPMFIKEPKEELKRLTFKTKKQFKEAHCPEIFKQLNIDNVEKNCTCFKKFITHLNQKLN